MGFWSFLTTSIIATLYYGAYFVVALALPTYCSLKVSQTNLRLNSQTIDEKRKRWITYWMLLIALEFAIWPVTFYL